MKKIFNSPEIEVMHLGAQDIITTSANTDETLTDMGPNATPDW